MASETSKKIIKGGTNSLDKGVHGHFTRLFPALPLLADILVPPLEKKKNNRRLKSSLFFNRAPHDVFFLYGSERQTLILRCECRFERKENFRKFCKRGFLENLGILENFLNAIPLKNSNRPKLISIHKTHPPKTQEST